MWSSYRRTHKCKGCGSKDHGKANYLAAKEKKAQEFDAGGKRPEQCVEIVDVVIVNKTESVYQFINAFPCLPVLARPNSETIRFQLANTSFPPLKELPLPRNPSAWTKLLQAYLRPLRVHLPMILCFGAVGYEGS